MDLLAFVLLWSDLSTSARTQDFLVCHGSIKRGEGRDAMNILPLTNHCLLRDWFGFLEQESSICTFLANASSIRLMSVALAHVRSNRDWDEFSRTATDLPKTYCCSMFRWNVAWECWSLPCRWLSRRVHRSIVNVLDGAATKWNRYAHRISSFPTRCSRNRPSLGRYCRNEDWDWWWSSMMAREATGRNCAGGLSCSIVQQEARRRCSHRRWITVDHHLNRQRRWREKVCFFFLSFQGSEANP